MSEKIVSSTRGVFFREVVYRPDLRELVISFPRGGVYRYWDIDPTLYDQLTNSLFPGSFYNSYIKGRFPIERIR